MEELQPEVHRHLRRWVAVALACAPAAASAHAADTVEPAALGLWLAFAALYAAGAVRARLRFGAPRIAAFCAGWAALGIALVSPLDAAGDASLTAHMVQHMLLVAVAPPLLLAGAAVAGALGALPARVARALARPLAGIGLAAATALQFAVIWGWHLPAALDWAARSDAAHAVMHACYVFAGLAFWHAAWRSPRGGIAIATTMAHMGLLGALLTFSPRAWYAAYPAIADQQLAGLVMWVPGSVPYLVGGLALIAAWLQRAEQVCGRPNIQADGPVPTMAACRRPSNASNPSANSPTNSSTSRS